MSPKIKIKWDFLSYFLQLCSHLKYSTKRPKSSFVLQPKKWLGNFENWAADLIFLRSPVTKMLRCSSVKFYFKQNRQWLIKFWDIHWKMRVSSRQRKREIIQSPLLYTRMYNRVLAWQAHDLWCHVVNRLLPSFLSNSSTQQIVKCWKFFQ